MNELQDVIHEFLVESYENLDQLDRDLVALEQDPTSQPLLGNIFRVIHTIKVLRQKPRTVAWPP